MANILSQKELDALLDAFGKTETESINKDTPENQKAINELAIIEYKTSQEKKAAIAAMSELLRITEQELVRLIFELGLESVKSAIVLKCLNFHTPLIRAD